MKRPLLYVLLFLVLGVLIGRFISSILLICVAFLIIIISCMYLNKFYSIKFFKFLFLVSFLGFVCIGLKNINSYKFVEGNSNITATGYIKDLQLTSTGKQKFILDAKDVYINGSKIKKSMKFLVYTDYSKNIFNGAIIDINGDIELPNDKNSNGYDEKLSFKIKNIDYKLYAKNIDVVGYSKFYKFINSITENIESIYDKILPQNESNILKAMLLGNKDLLDEDTVNLYRNAGIYHILAISGLHIGILALFMSKIFNKVSKRYGSIVVILILILYCIFTGGSLSTIRATIMCITVLVANIIYRDADFLSSISFSAIILILVNPYYIFDIGFLYSYVSVFSIGFLGGRICDIYNIKGILQSLIVSFFVCISIKPITAYSFYNFITLDFILNIIILPFMSIVVGLGFLATIIGIFSIPIAEFFIGSVYYILRLFTYICKVVDNMSFNNINIGPPQLIIVIGLYIMLCCIAYSVYDKYLILKRKKYINIGIIIFILCIALGSITPTRASITMLDVGQGDSIVGVSKDGVFIVDGGGQNNYSVGDNIVLPYLRSRGIDKIDFAFITHTDSDHIKGIIEIIDDIEIDNIFLPKTAILDKNYFNLLKTANEYNVSIYTLDVGDTITLGKNTVFEIIHPSDEFSYSDPNNNSLVFKMTYKDKSILFTGDIEKEAERFIVANDEDIEADIIKIAHHGSKSSSTEEFIERVNPSIALISSKENNSYNHPSPETIDLLEEKGIEIYRTDKSSNITIYLDRKDFKVETLLD